ncbi:MAG TPA: N-acetyltransferase, partial [Plasticicumulans sp.]|nr:N-acetyltransferase [Plasticicumulans sp.]
WFGLAPLAVAPAYQGRGIGARLVRTGLAALQARGAGGCVVLGEPAYYARFGFAALPVLVCAWPVPPQYFQALAWQPLACAGIVRYHPLFGAV